MRGEPALGATAPALAGAGQLSGLEARDPFARDAFEKLVVYLDQKRGTRAYVVTSSERLRKKVAGALRRRLAGRKVWSVDLAEPEVRPAEALAQAIGHEGPGLLLVNGISDRIDGLGDAHEALGPLNLLREELDRPGLAVVFWLEMRHRTGMVEAAPDLTRYGRTVEILEVRDVLRPPPKRRGKVDRRLRELREAERRVEELRKEGAPAEVLGEALTQLAVGRVVALDLEGARAASNESVLLLRGESRFAARAWCEQTVILDCLGDVEGAAKAASRARAAAPKGDHFAAFQALWASAWTASGGAALAWELAATAAVGLQLFGDQAIALSNAANNHHIDGLLGSAMSTAALARRASTRAGDDGSASIALRASASTSEEQGRIDDNWMLLERAKEHLSRPDDEAGWRREAGVVCFEFGDFEQAMLLIQPVIGLVGNHGDSGEALRARCESALGNLRSLPSVSELPSLRNPYRSVLLAELALGQCEPAEATRLTESCPTCRAIYRLLLDTLALEAKLALAALDGLQEHRATILDSLSTLEPAGYVKSLVAPRIRLALASVATHGDLDEGQSMLERSLEDAFQCRFALEIPWVFAGLALIAEVRGDSATATGHETSRRWWIDAMGAAGLDRRIENALRGVRSLRESVAH